MKSTFCLASLLLAVAAMVVLSGDGTSVGAPVSDQLAAELHGGCAGARRTDECSAEDKKICDGRAYVNWSLVDDKDPSGVTAYYCTETVNGTKVCDTCSAGYVSCSTTVAGIPGME